jgi:hypothetical protein
MLHIDGSNDLVLAVTGRTGRPHMIFGQAEEELEAKAARFA